MIKCSILSTVQKFCPDYELLLELHALTLAVRSYALLAYATVVLGWGYITRVTPF